MTLMTREQALQTLMKWLNQAPNKDGFIKIDRGILSHVMTQVLEINAKAERLKVIAEATRFLGEEMGLINPEDFS